MRPSDLKSRRVLIVEDDHAVRRSFRELLHTAGYEVCEAPTIAAARLMARQPQDLHAALVDYALPDGRVTELVAELLQRRPLCRCVVVTGTTAPNVASETAQAGAHAYLQKPKSGPEVLEAVERTIRSTMEWRRALATRSREGTFHFDVSAAVARLRAIGRLSPAETLTAWRLLWGDSNKRIASLLGCSERTVKFHVADVLARTGARSRAGLLRVLLEDAGVFDPWGDKE